MRTESKFKHALKEMMMTMPLSDINVTALCEKCGCHRQTFYYHFQNIYDLLAAYFLNEKVPGLMEAGTPEKALLSLVDYSKANFEFLKSSYDSAAHELVEDFFYNKMISRLFVLLNERNEHGLTASGYRSVSRRYSRIAADEFGVQFRNQNITPAKLDKAMKHFIKSSMNTVFPALIELAKKERAR